MTTTREFCPADRYVYDFGLCHFKKGWAQVDTSEDAPWFGTWASPSRRAILTYCEGDVTLQQADTDEEFAAELRRIKAWNEEQGHRFLGIDAACDPGMIAAFEALGLGDLLH